MVKEFRLQDPGEGIHEVEIREILVAEGDQVEEGDDVLVVESDKAAIEVPAPYSGTIEELRVEEGGTAEVGDVLMTFDTGDDEPATESDEDEDVGPADDGETNDDVKATDDECDAAGAQVDVAEGEGERDTGESESGEAAERDESPSASPVARRIAADRDVDLSEVKPSGPHGRVLADDVRAAADEDSEETGDQAERQPRRTVEKAAGTLPDFERWGEVERQKLRSIRRATAWRMAQSWGEIPHVTHQDHVDITELEAFRQRHADDVEKEGGKLTLTAFALKAAAAALREHPRFNASLDVETEEIVLKCYCHIGVAIDTEQGLLVPVLRDVDRKSIVELAVELSDVAARARDNRLQREEMTGGSFTLTNVGPLGGTAFAPIINYPEVAILGLAQARWQPVVENGEAKGSIVPRLVLPLCLGFDHRVVDGADAARFTRMVATTLANVEAFALVS